MDDVRGVSALLARPRAMVTPETAARFAEACSDETAVLGRRLSRPEALGVLCRMGLGEAEHRAMSEALGAWAPRQFAHGNIH